MPRSSHGLPGVYNATPLTLTDGDGSALAINASGQVIAAAPSGSSANQIQGTAADNAAAVGNPVLTGAEYNATPPTYGDGDVANTQADENGNTKVTLATKLDQVNDAVTTYEAGWNITTISTATTTVVAAFPAVVKDIRAIGGTLGNVTVYDNTAASGTAVIPAVTPDKGQVLIGAPSTFAVGCTVVTASATILTVTWRAQ